MGTEPLIVLHPEDSFTVGNKGTPLVTIRVVSGDGAKAQCVLDFHAIGDVFDFTVDARPIHVVPPK